MKATIWLETCNNWHWGVPLMN